LFLFVPVVHLVHSFYQAGSREASAFSDAAVTSASSFSSERRYFLCRRLHKLLLQNPNMMSYNCGDGAATIDHVQHKEICSRLELCIALMTQDPSCTIGVVTEAQETEETIDQIHKAAQENRHYPSSHIFHIPWRCSFQPQGDVLLLFALVGWTFDVSFTFELWFVRFCYS